MFIRENVIALTTLRDHVGHVLLLRTKEEMLWVDAKRRVAPMADVHAGRDRPNEPLIRELVGTHGFPVEVDIAVAVGAYWPTPDPAIILVAMRGEVIEPFVRAHSAQMPGIVTFLSFKSHNSSLQSLLCIDHFANVNP